MTDTLKYDFAFTALSLRLKEMVLVAEAMNDSREFDFVNSLGHGKASTGKRIYAELTKRISKLTSEELELLVNGDLSTQKQIAFLAICKTYPFIRDFVVEVLRDKFLVFDYEISEGEYLSFYRKNAEMHPEMEEFTIVTQKKLRQVTFKILQEAGIIESTKNKTIQAQLISDKTVEVIIKDDFQWLKIFLISDIDIQNWTNRVWKI